MLSSLVVENDFEGQTLVMLPSIYDTVTIQKHSAQYKLCFNTSKTFLSVNVEEIIVNLRIILICFQGNYSAHFTLTMQCISTKAGL